MHKRIDSNGRWRSKTVGFRLSPKEADKLDFLATTSGLSKQNYILKRVFNEKVYINPNPRIQKYFSSYLQEILIELKKLQTVKEQDKEILDNLKYLVDAIEQMGLTHKKSPYPAR